MATLVHRLRAGPEPALNRLGRALPAAWQSAVRQARGLDAATLVADLFRSHAVDDYGLDPAAARRWLFLLERTVCRYFRLTVLGAEHLPPGRCLVVGCHSGVLPWDAACLMVALHRATGRFSRNAGDRLFGRFAPVLRVLAASGVVIAEAPALEDLLCRDELVLLFPGGAEDMRRPIWERYRVKPHKGFAPGNGGYVKIALRAASPIVPVAIVGAEETHMLLADVRPLARLLGMPYFPIVVSALPLPARLYVRFGEPIQLDLPPAAAGNQELVDRLNVTVHGRLQALIDDTRRRRRGIYCSTYEDDSGGDAG
jgi:1-acyl-sn-glycerol-3-phosphate acyltransferase